VNGAVVYVKLRNAAEEDYAELDSLGVCGQGKIELPVTAILFAASNRKLEESGTKRPA